MPYLDKFAPDEIIGPPTKPQKPVCSKCGSDDVSIDALARWNVAKQQWEISGTLDSSDCERCQGECELEWTDA